MALSNMLREPRREITESVVGLLIFAVYMSVSYWFALWICEQDRATPFAVAMVFSMLGVFYVPFALMAVMFVVHVAGDIACDMLEAIGVHLRPRQRY